MDVSTVEQVEAPVEVVPAEPPPLSVSDHASVYGPQAKDKADPDAPEGETQAQKAERLHHSAQQKRERETGKFEPGKVRKRAASQVADPEEAGRIPTLTKNWRTAERERDEARAELARLKSLHAPAPQIARAEAKAETATAKVVATTAASSFTEPEPSEDELDTKYGGDYSKLLRAQAAWEARKTIHEAKMAEREAVEREKTEGEIRKKAEGFSKRVDAARQKYADFDAAANDVIAKVPANSAVEAWFAEHQRAEDVVYYLHTHQQELDAILTMPSALEQFEALTLLAQRFASPTQTGAATTGSDPSRKTVVVLPPRPPNPVRTEAQRASDSPPPTDGSLSVAEHSKAFGPKRR